MSGGDVVRSGMDPLEEKRQARIAQELAKARTATFAECVDAYLDAHGDSWKNPKHRQQWRNTLETYAGPVIGSLPVSEVDMEGISPRALEFAILTAAHSGEVRHG